jgi:hypothetical protein
VIARPPVLRALAVGLVAVLLASGCAWRAGGVEHYVGPVAFRYRPADEARGSVSQVVRLGVALEGGAQWGVATGMIDRLACAPTTHGDDPDHGAPRWVLPLSPLGPPTPGRWNVSLLYLRVEAMPAPLLVVRRMLGAEITLGGEANAASLGWTSRALVQPPPDALSLVRYDSRRPLDTVVAAWPPDSVAAHDAWMSPKEDAP